MGGGGREGTHVSLWLIHVVVWQKSAQHCKAISLQLKKKKRQNQEKKNTKKHKTWNSFEDRKEMPEKVEAFDVIFLPPVHLSWLFNQMNS